MQTVGRLTAKLYSKQHEFIHRGSNVFNRDYLSRNLAWAFCVAPFACGLPLVFERLLSFVIAVENKGGGLFYAPTSLTEVALVLLILATAFPLLITVAVTVIPIAFVTQSMRLMSSSSARHGRLSA
jgi:hypothetical protein